jgi:hypothetical protein
LYIKRACELNKSHIISTDEDPGLRIESFAVINLRGVSTNKTIIITTELDVFDKKESDCCCYGNHDPSLWPILILGLKLFNLKIRSVTPIFYLIKIVCLVFLIIVMIFKKFCHYYIFRSQKILT